MLADTRMTEAILTGIVFWLMVAFPLLAFGVWNTWFKHRTPAWVVVFGILIGWPIAFGLTALTDLWLL